MTQRSRIDFRMHYSRVYWIPLIVSMAVSSFIVAYSIEALKFLVFVLVVYWVMAVVHYYTTYLSIVDERYLEYRGSLSQFLRRQRLPINNIVHIDLLGELRSTTHRNILFVLISQFEDGHLYIKSETESGLKHTTRVPTPKLQNMGTDELQSFIRRMKEINPSIEFSNEFGDEE